MLSKSAVDHLILLWKICGCWYYPDQPRWHLVYSVFVLWSAFIIIPILMMINLVLAADLNEMLEVFLILPTGLGGVKAWLIIRDQRMMHELFHIMDALDSYVLSDNYRLVIKQAVKRVQLLAWILGVGYFCSASGLCLAAILSNDRVLVWTFWLPFDYQQSKIVYRMVLTYQVFVSYYMGFILLAVDVYSGTMYIMLSAHLDVLGMRLKDLGNSAPKFLIQCPVNNSVLLKTSEKKLGNCIFAHILCLKFSDCLNTSLSGFYLMQFGFSMAALCGSEFKLSRLDPTKDKEAVFATSIYLMCLTMQIFTPCYCASTLTDKSDRLPGSIFYSRWWEQTKRFKSSMLIFAERAMKPIVPKAGGLFAVGLPIFVSIMKTGYTLFAAMKNMDI